MKEMLETPGPNLYLHISFSGFTTANYGPDSYGRQVTPDTKDSKHTNYLQFVSKMFLYLKLRAQYTITATKFDFGNYQLLSVYTSRRFT
jgi:hypothetical protein